MFSEKMELTDEHPRTCTADHAVNGVRANGSGLDARPEHDAGTGWN